MITECATIVSNINIKGKYYRLDFSCKKIAALATPGQFVHIQIKNLRDRLFRRPFSIYDVSEDGILSIIYKIVGIGTEVMSQLKEGESCDILGPLGNGYTIPDKKEYPLLVTGGYGAAATFLLAKRSPGKGKILMGAKNSNELILCDEYRKLGFDIELATDDGSSGYHGLVTELLVKNLSTDNKKIYGCGPNLMMHAMVNILNKNSKIAELSFDEHMCCGVGACFGCVVKVASENKDSWEYKRSCKEGPVFKSNEIIEYK